MILNKKSDLSKKVISLFLLISFLLYIFTPMRGSVSMPFFYFCFGFMLLSNYIFFKAKKKENYLDFDTIFIVVYCLVGFSTTFFYYDRYLFSGIFLGFAVDDEYINKGNLLFLIGLQSYMVGSLTHIKKYAPLFKPRVISSKYIAILIVLLIIIFFVSGGLTFFKSAYDESVKSEGAGIAKHVLLLLVAAAMALIGTEFYNKKISQKYKVSKIVFSILVLVTLLLLSVGNRTAASQIFLPMFCFYAMYFKPVSLKKFIVFVVVGIFSMWVVQKLRTGIDTLELTNPIYLILDLTIPMRNTYTSLKYVDVNGHTYGGTMALEASGVIPFLPSVVQDVFPDFKNGSAELLTQYSFNTLRVADEVQVGLGTTITADTFLAFGVLGTILFMWFLGYYVKKITVKSIYLDYYSVIILSALIGNAIFVVRAGFLHPLRFIVWALVIASINRFLFRLWRR